LQYRLLDRKTNLIGFFDPITLTFIVIEKLLNIYDPSQTYLFFTSSSSILSSFFLCEFSCFYWNSIYTSRLFNILYWHNGDKFI